MKKKYKKSLANKIPKNKSKVQTKIQVESKNKKFLLIAILLLTIMVYFPTFTSDFTNWDDGGYITENQLIHNLSFENVKTIFTEYFISNYHPLTLLSLSLDFQIAGQNPFVFHFVNVLLHLINIVLVFWMIFLILEIIGLSNKTEIALITAALFAVHTLHVESVSWISERKDLLYSMFFLASIIQYLKFVKSKKNKNYIFSLLFFILSLLSKGMAVSLALSLIAIDLVLKRKILSKKVLLEKIPYFILSLIFGIVALHAQQTGDAIADGSVFKFYERILFACYGFCQYHFKLLMPVNLSAIYPYPIKIGGAIPAKFYFFLIIFIALSVGLILTIKRSHFGRFGILFFLANIIFVMQIIPVGSAMFADRYTYIPSIGYFFLVGFFFHQINQKYRNFRKFGIAIISLYILILSVLTFNRTKVWENSMTLWDDVLSKHTEAPIAWINRGNAKYKIKKYQSAIKDYNQALAHKPDQAQAYLNRATARKETGDLIGAVKDYNKSLKLNPNQEKAYYNRGGAFLDLAKFSQALEDYNKAIELKPDYAQAYSNRANVYLNLQNLEAAMSDYDNAILLKPDYSEAYANRGIAFTIEGNDNAAISDFSKTIELNPKDGTAYFLRGMSKIKIGKKDDACKDYYKAQSLGFAEASREIQKYCK